MKADAAIHELLQQLRAFPGGECLTNPYARCDARHDCPQAPEIRCRNLTLYLQRLRAQTAPLLIVGEAAGYQGCRFSGIAFTSEQTLAQHPFFKGGDFRRSGTRPRLWSEPSGRIVWEISDQLPNLPVLWNIVPFHPHLRDNPLSNRTPTASERAAGLPFLQMLLKIFPEARLIAAGRLAALSLAAAGLEHVAVRHPSHGGKREFRAGVLRAVSLG